MNKKVLVLERGSMTDASLRVLVDAGFTLTFIHNIDGIRQIGDVPLRDYFAAASISGALAGGLARGMTHQQLATAAFAQADAMLTEREKEAS